MPSSELRVFDYFGLTILVLDGDRFNSACGLYNPGKRVHPHETLTNRASTFPALENNLSAGQSSNVQFYQVRGDELLE